jgi:hypothetical protein
MTPLYIHISGTSVISVIKSKLIPSSADEIELLLSRNALKDIKNTIDNTKNRRSDEARVTMALLTASVSGESIKQSRSRVSLAKRLGVSVKRLARSAPARTQILHSNKSCFEYTKRKTRSHALTEDLKKRIYDFWCLPEISHPTGNKNDIKRVRVGTKQYRSHAVQILEQSQSEVYTDFKSLHPDVQISQRSFEKCKPFFIRAAKPKDRIMCCRRYHLEIKHVFKSCMEFRRKLTKNGPQGESVFKIYDSVYDMCHETLCSKDQQGYYKKRLS